MEIPFNVLDFLDRAELVFGDRVGVVDEPNQPAGSWGEMTWREVAAHVRALAAGLDALGIERGARVAIVSQNSARLLVALFAVSGYGRVAVPVNFRLNAEEVGYIVEHAGASVLLVDPELDEALAGVTARHRFVLGPESDEQLLRFDRQPDPWVDPSEHAVASINYTSGTTARPKGVELTHRNLYVNAMTFGWHTGVAEDDVYLWAVPMFHCNGWGLVYAITAMGGRHVLLRKVDGPEILRRIDRHGVTFMGGAPAVINTVLAAAAAGSAEPVPGRDRMRIVVGGAPPPTTTIERVETELGWEFMQVYGLTETSPLLTLNRRRSEWMTLDPTQRARLLGRAGPPAIGVRVRVDGSGEVLARGNVVFGGYWQQPEQSATAIVDGWFHTGDGGRLHDGFVTISDRKKDVIITGGENVSSIDVEDCLCDHPDVVEAAVIGLPDERWGETVSAVVVLAEGSLTTGADLIDHCRARIAHYKCPTSITFAESLERTATGKVQKYKLRDRFAQTA